ncbi:hypothetical protein EVAR_51763_1 [Eumeta japonica]|uniref:Uncharacterized protein n=1 Tax=Eumeta variegata TaxID=151549 RepID=A0A4C1XC53_EUMVA|nr:hypothetical protein EVAR_51763_1 [Eumeta japonica]
MFVGNCQLAPTVGNSPPLKKLDKWVKSKSVIVIDQARWRYPSTSVTRAPPRPPRAAPRRACRRVQYTRPRAARSATPSPVIIAITAVTCCDIALKRERRRPPPAECVTSIAPMKINNRLVARNGPRQVSAHLCTLTAKPRCKSAGAPPPAAVRGALVAFATLAHSRPQILIPRGVNAPVNDYSKRKLCAAFAATSPVEATANGGAIGKKYLSVDNNYDFPDRRRSCVVAGCRPSALPPSFAVS